VRKLLSRCGLANEKTYAGQLGAAEWWLPDLAQALAVSPYTLRWWARHGWVHARRTPAQGLWIVYADKQELKRLRELAARSYRGAKNHPAKLTTPGTRRTTIAPAHPVVGMDSANPVSSKE
jgi:hypothetical protein